MDKQTNSVKKEERKNGRGVRIDERKQGRNKERQARQGAK